MKQFDRRAIPADAHETIWTAGDGHQIRRLEWVAPEAGPRGSLLFMPGRGDFYEKHLEAFEHWRQQGWQVTAGCWRGQAGSGRLGADEVTGHVDDFAHWIADFAGIWRDWAAEHDGPLVLVGHSMGGHLALRAVAEAALEPMPDALVLSAPMLDVHPENVPVSVRRALARLMLAVGDPRRPAWKWSEKPGEVPRFRQRLLTHDATRYADELWWREQRPELKMGPGSWGWVASALRSVRGLVRRETLSRVRIPVMIVGTHADRLVSPKAMIRAARMLPDVELLMFGPEAAHEILREADPVRLRALAAIDRFLDAKLQR